MNILNNLKTLAVIIMTAMAFTSCSKDQTSLSVDDIQGKAKIKGIIFYSEGVEYKNNDSHEIIKMATNTTILVKISNNQLSLKGNAYGFTTFETVTNDKGEYEIEVPALENGTTIIIQPQSFVGKYKSIDEWNNGKPVYATLEGIFEAKESCSVTPNQIIFKDIEYEFNER